MLRARGLGPRHLRGGILCFDAGKPLASLAFNARRNVLAVTSMGTSSTPGAIETRSSFSRAPRQARPRRVRGPHAAREDAAAVAAHEDAVAAHLANLGAPGCTAPAASVHRSSRAAGGPDIQPATSRAARPPGCAVPRSRAVSCARCTSPARRPLLLARPELRASTSCPRAARRQPQPQGRVRNRLRRGVGGGHGGAALCATAAAAANKTRRGRHGHGGSDRIGTSRRGRFEIDARRATTNEQTTKKHVYLGGVRAPPSRRSTSTPRARTPSSSRATPSGGST